MVFAHQRLKNTVLALLALVFLASCGPRDKVPVLIKRLGNDNPKVRSRAALELKRIGAPAVPPLIAALGHEDSTVRASAAWVLGEIRDTSAIPVLSTRLKPETDPAERAAVIEALCAMGKPAVPALAEVVNDPDRETRSKAIHALGEMNDPRIVASLSHILASDPDTSVRTMALEAIAVAGDTAVQPVICALQDQCPTIRVLAVQFLGAVKNPRAVKPLTEVLRNDEVQAVRIAVLEALCAMGDTGATALVGALSTGDTTVRERAVRILANMRHSRFIGPLTTTLRNDRSPSVRAAALAALGAMGDTAVMSVVYGLRDVRAMIRERAADILGEIGNRRAVPALNDALSDSKPDVRIAAAEALGAIKDRRSVGPLNALVDDDDEEISVRRAAADALDALEGAGIEVPETQRRIQHARAGCTMMAAGRCRFVGECGGR